MRAQGSQEMGDPLSVDLDRYGERLHLPLPTVEGRVTEVLGLLIEGALKGAAVGDLCEVAGRSGDVLAEVVALKGNRAMLMPFGALQGLSVGAHIVPRGEASKIQVGEHLLGRVIDALGRPLDGGQLLERGVSRAVHAEPLSPFDRRPVKDRLNLGIRALDAFVPCGRGQRLGIFAGPGVGKSVLLGMMAKATNADVVVLALVGERGREVGDFVDRILGPEGLKRSVVVVATSDRPPPERVRAAAVATSVAEHFRDKGKSVLLFVDSLTRFCMAQREIGLAVGEPPTSKGYPPSVFAQLPKLLERAAPARAGGSLTGLYTVLVEGDEMDDPIADAARGLLDGHIVLSRSLANRGHYPAVDVLQSLSRLEGDLMNPVQREQTRRVRGWLGRLDESRDLIAVGAYRAGADPELDLALRKSTAIDAFLRQAIDEHPSEAETLEQLRRVSEVTP